MQVYVFEWGNTHPIPNSEDWNRKHDFNMIYCDSDANVNRLFAHRNPDVIITVADSSDQFGSIGLLPLYIRRRWLHYKSKEEITPSKIQTCFVDNLRKGYGPQVSIFTTTYKSMERIQRPFRSLVNQTLTEWEWVILDDSPLDDKTWDSFLVPLAEKDCRIRLYRSIGNNGFIGSVKRDAASLCRGELCIVELDHDDELVPRALYLLCQAFEKHPSVGMIGSDCIELYEHTLRDFSYGDFYGYGFHSYSKQWHENRWVSVAHNGPLNKYTIRHIIGVLNHVRAWRTVAYHEIGKHNHRLYVADDYDLIVRTFLSKWVIGRLPVMLYKQFRNEGGDNFTNHRNRYIGTLTRYMRFIHDDAIHAKLEELGMEDDLVGKAFSSPKTMAFEHSEPDPSADLVLDPAPERVSIIMPTFKRSKLMCRAVKSILAQTFANWVLYIVGDCCPVLNDTMKKKGYLHDERIRWWNLSENRKSGCHGRNYALKMASTNYIAYLDDDNYWRKDHLASLYLALTQQKADDGRTPSFVFSSFVFEEKGMLQMSIHCREPKLFRIDTSCIMHRKELLDKYGYWRPETICGYAVDWDLVKRWVNAKEPWIATHLYTLFYNNTHQDMEAIRTALPDQTPDDKMAFQNEETKTPEETQQHTGQTSTTSVVHIQQNTDREIHKLACLIPETCVISIHNPVASSDVVVIADANATTLNEKHLCSETAVDDLWNEVLVQETKIDIPHKEEEEDNNRHEGEDDEGDDTGVDDVQLFLQRTAELSSEEDDERA